MCRQTSSDWVNDNAPRLSAAVAFYTLLSLAPVIVIAVSLAAVVYGRDAAEGRPASETAGVAGPAAAKTIQEIIKGGNQSRIGAVAAVPGFGDPGIRRLFRLRRVTRHVSLPSHRSDMATMMRLVRERFYSFMTVLGTGFLLLIFLVLNAWMAAMSITVPRAATWIVSCLLIAALFAVLYRIVPEVELKWSDVALGAAVTSVLFMVGRASGRRIAPPAHRLSCCSGSTTRLNCSFGAPNSPKCTPRRWAPKGVGTLPKYAVSKVESRKSARTLAHARGSDRSRDLQGASCRRVGELLKRCTKGRLKNKTPPIAVYLS